MGPIQKNGNGKKNDVQKENGNGIKGETPLPEGPIKGKTPEELLRYILGDDQRSAYYLKIMMMDNAASVILLNISKGNEKSVEEYEKNMGLDLLEDALRLALAGNKKIGGFSLFKITEEEIADKLNKMLEEVRRKKADAKE